MAAPTQSRDDPEIRSEASTRRLDAMLLPPFLPEGIGGADRLRHHLRFDLEWLIVYGSASAVLRAAIRSSISPVISASPIAASVVGSPTLVAKPRTSSNSAWGFFSRIQLHQYAVSDLLTVKVRLAKSEVLGR